LNFKNKVVLITSASIGIREASAIQFAKKRANVVLVAPSFGLPGTAPYCASKFSSFRW